MIYLTIKIRDLLELIKKDNNFPIAVFSPAFVPLLCTKTHGPCVDSCKIKIKKIDNSTSAQETPLLGKLKF
jgi:hypothetical protein